MHIRPSHFILQGGRTALHCAAYMGRLDLIPLLVDADADVNARDAVSVYVRSQRSPLPHHDACQVTGGQDSRRLGAQVEGATSS